MKRTKAIFSSLLVLLTQSAQGDFSLDESLPMQLQAFQKPIEVVLQHFALSDETEGRWRENQEKIATTKQQLLPSLNASAGINRRQTNTSGNTSNTSSNDLQFGLSLRQNLFNGGSDLKRLTLSEKREQLAFMQVVFAKRSHVRNWLKDVALIRHQMKVVRSHAEATQQAKSLNQLAQRKEASGFLGKRDLLDSQRELLRVEQETLKAQDALNESIERHKKIYNFMQPESLGDDDFKRFGSEKLSQMRLKEIAESIDKIKSSSLPIVIANIEKNIVEEESQLANLGRFNPRVDAIFQANATRQYNESDSSPVGNPRSVSQMDNTRSWSIALSGELSLVPSAAFGVVEENRRRFATAKLSFQKTCDDVALSIESTIRQLQKIKVQKTSFEKLVSLTEQLRDKNQRLFEAGELSIDRLISSQQDLNRDRLSLASIAIDELNLSIDLTLNEVWNLPPASSAAARASSP